jgi:glutamyl-tRNA reductase
LKEVVQENLQSRAAAAIEAEKIIDTRVVDFMQWVRTLDAVPTIRQLRENADAIRETELRLAQRRLARGEDPAKVLEQLARALTNKFTHAPSDALKRADDEGNDQLLAAARRLFGLDEA